MTAQTPAPIPAAVLGAAVEDAAREWSNAPFPSNASKAKAERALTAALPRVVAAAKAEWEKPIRSLADEWDSRSAARGDYGQPDSPSHAASELRDLLDERAATYRKESE